MTTQTQIPGTERTKIPEVETAAEALRTVRTQRIALSKDEIKLAAQLAKVLKDNGIEIYHYTGPEGQDLEAERFEGKVKVKVRTVKVGGQAEDDDDETEH